MRSYIFGKFIDNVSKVSINKVLKEAEKKRKRVRNYPVEKIINILDKVSYLWEDKNYHLRRKALKLMPALTGFHEKMIEEEIDFLVDLLKRENLEKRIACELGNMDILNSWSYCSKLSGYTRAEPRGVVIHIGAGNVFVGPLDSLTQGFITKNVNILKMSSDDPVFPLLFCESLQEADTEGILSSSFSVISWKSADKETETLVKKNADAVVVYGGKEAVESYRKDLGVYTRLIEYGPKYSLALVAKEFFDKKDIAYGIALDVSRWEQSACASPHVVYVEKGKVKFKNAEKLAELIAEVFKKINKVLPQKKLSIDEKVEIKKVRQLAKAAKAHDEAEYLFGKGNESWSVILEKEEGFTISCLNRTLFVKEVDNLFKVPDILKDMGRYIQTVSIAADEEKRKKVADLFAFTGADRFTSIGKMTSRVHGVPHDGVYSLEQLVKWVSLTGDKEEIVKDSLKELVLFAKQNSPFYKKKFKNVKFDNIKTEESNNSWWEKVPLTAPDELKKNLPPKNTDALTQTQPNGYVFTSGGTTGDPKFVFRTVEEQDYNAGFLAKGLLSAALDKGDTVANLLFAGNMWGSFLSFSKAIEKAGCINLPIGGNIEAEEILNYLVMFKPDAVLAIPSVLMSIASLAKEKKVKIKIPKILSGGEHIFKENLNYIKKVFSSERIASIGYATNDVGAIGYQCRHLSGGLHHINSKLQYVEILNSQTLKPVKKGEEGKIIVTNLNRRLQPVIRYDVGDMGRWVYKECPCGVKGPLFELLGRSDDVLIIGGGNIYPEVIREAIENIKGLSPNFSLTAELNKGKDQLVIKAEASSSSADLNVLSKKLEEKIYSNSKELTTMLSKKLIAPITVEVLPPGSIPRNKRTGKIRLTEDKRK
ncbi:MAG: aldehyde dehydrogenase family protein [Armatimonadota bacterium]